jgi:hypothetical protein
MHPDPNMPKKKSDLTKPSADLAQNTLLFTTEVFDDPETGKPTQYGRFARNWQDEEALDVLIDRLEAGQITHKQALMQARKLEATTPYNLESRTSLLAGCGRWGCRMRPPRCMNGPTTWHWPWCPRASKARSLGQKSTIGLFCVWRMVACWA